MKGKILIVDDELLVNKFLEVKLKKEDLHVDLAYDGQQALDKIHTNKYDLILTDMMLPFIAGGELILQIKRSKYNAETPILVLSSLANEEVIIGMLAIGAQDYIIKPFSMNIVLAKIKQLLKLNTAA